MELSMEYFDSEALTKEQEIGHLKAPPPTSRPKLPSNGPRLNMIYHWRLLCVINECCRIWRSHLIVFLQLLGYFAPMHVSLMQK